jgi:hypothetical protein
MTRRSATTACTDHGKQKLPPGKRKPWHP